MIKTATLNKASLFFILLLNEVSESNPDAVISPPPRVQYSIHSNAKTFEQCFYITTMPFPLLTKLMLISGYYLKMSRIQKFLVVLNMSLSSLMGELGFL